MTRHEFTISLYFPEQAAPNWQDDHLCATAQFPAPPRRADDPPGDDEPGTLLLYYLSCDRDVAIVGAFGVPQTMILQRLDAQPVWTKDNQREAISQIGGLALTWDRVWEWAHEEVLRDCRERTGRARYANLAHETFAIKEGGPQTTVSPED